MTEIVQVSFGAHSWKGLPVYCYNDDSKMGVGVGDLVTVTGKLRFSIGTVVALGRGDYKGAITEKLTGMMDWVPFG